MKTAALLFSGLIVSALFSAPTVAEPVRVRVTARVSEVSDPNNVFAGRIAIGQRVTGTYVYNTNTPNQSQDPSYAEYHPYANEARVRFAVASFIFESVQPTQQIAITVAPQNGGDGQFLMTSLENKPLASGETVNEIAVDFQGSGNLTASKALVNAAPTLPNYWTRDVTLQGNSYFVRAQIEVAELIVAETFEISPAAGSFIPNQHFDAALTLPRNSVVASAHATANGVALPLSYPGTCHLEQHNNTSKPSVLCPGADAALPFAGGAPIEWTIELTNGTVLTQTVNWELAE